MALSHQERNLIREGMALLEKYMNRDLEPISEAPIRSDLISDLKDVEKIMASSKLAILGENEFPDKENSSIAVSLYFMSNKNVTITNEMSNYLNISYDIDPEDNSVLVRSSLSKTSLENFIELPINSTDKDAIPTQSIIRQCDSNRIYNIYQDRALSTIRKLFPHAYYMFTGPNLFKSAPIFDKSMTLAVAYDPIRKRFRYMYNPDFILMCAIDEFSIHRKKYRSLEGCYTYLLAFFITHEMLHIIHHNTTSSMDGDTLVDIGSHEIANIIQDSFINCKIIRRFAGADGIIKGYGETAPMPSIGVGSRITIRCEHNEGFKSYKNIQELAEVVFDTIVRELKLDRSSYGKIKAKNTSLEEYAGADIFISVDINSGFSPIRNNSSNLFQSCFNSIVKCVTNGKVFDKFTKVSDEEKVSDLDIIPNDTLVLVKGSRDICYVESYDEDREVYNLIKAQVEGVDKISQSDGTILNVTKYGKSTITYGKKKRYQIKPYDPNTDAYISDESVKKPKKDKLSNDDLQPPPPLPPNGASEESKVLCVGDIVWVRKLKKFGRIRAINNGVFELDEVIEKPVKVLDDSLNYSKEEI